MNKHTQWDEEGVHWSEFKTERAGKRKLLITTDNFLPRWDGISRFLSEIVPRLQDEYEITILAPEYGYVHIEGVHIEKIPLSSKTYGDYTPAQFAYRRILRLVRAHDLVLNQALGPIGVCAILAARRAHRPIASYIHSVEWELFPKALANPLLRGPLVGLTRICARMLYNRCTLLILPSENIAEQFSWQRIRTPKRIAHLGVNTHKFIPADAHAARVRLGLPKDALIIGYHGRIAHEKNLLTLARAFGRLRVANKKLLIVGDGVLKLKSRLENYPNVIIAGAKDDVVPWLQAMDIYVQPSLTETTSLSVLEAMACKLPVISSRVGFIKYYIIDRENGMFFDQASTYDLAVKLGQLSSDVALRAKIAANARKTIEKSFQWENTAQAIRDALRSI